MCVANCLSFPCRILLHERVSSLLRSAADGHTCRCLVSATVTKAAVNTPRCLRVDVCACKSLRRHAIPLRGVHRAVPCFTNTAKHQSFEASGVKSAQTPSWRKGCHGASSPSTRLWTGMWLPQLATPPRGAQEAHGGGGRGRSAGIRLFEIYRKALVEFSVFTVRKFIRGGTVSRLQGIVQMTRENKFSIGP